MFGVKRLGFGVGCQVSSVKCPYCTYCGGVQAGCTALQRAAAEGHLDLVKQLLKHKADVNMQDDGVSTAWHGQNLHYRFLKNGCLSVQVGG